MWACQAAGLAAPSHPAAPTCAAQQSRARQACHWGRRRGVKKEWRMEREGKTGDWRCGLDMERRSRVHTCAVLEAPAWSNCALHPIILGRELPGVKYSLQLIEVVRSGQWLLLPWRCSFGVKEMPSFASLTGCCRLAWHADSALQSANACVV